MAARYVCVATADAVPAPASSVTYKEVDVIVLDDTGQPVEGAVISPNGWRIEPNGMGEAFREDIFGSRQEVTTDKTGKALLKYPDPLPESGPRDKPTPGPLLDFSVFHDGFASLRLSNGFRADGTAPPIRLKRAPGLVVSGYTGENHESVKFVVPKIDLEDPHWDLKDDNTVVCQNLSPGSHFILLMGLLPSGLIGYSEVQAFTAETGKSSRFALALKPGVRIEGKIDDRVPRPVKGGWAIVSVRPSGYPSHTDADKMGKIDLSLWESYREIAANGTFVFESVPAGELDLIAYGDGFVSTQPHRSFLQKNFGYPRSIALSVPTTRIEVPTEKTSTLQLTVKTPDGKPSVGAVVMVTPNAAWNDFHSTEFGRAPGADELLLDSVRTSMKAQASGSNVQSAESGSSPSHPHPEFSDTTDSNGVATIRNLPAFAATIYVVHGTDQTEAPLPGKLSPGRTAKLDFTFRPGTPQQ